MSDPRPTTPPRRVRVTSPRRPAVRRGPARPPSIELAERTALGEVYLADLVGAQLRVAGRVLAATALGVGALAVLFVVAPQAHAATIASVPLPWIVLGALAYVLLYWAAAACARASERIEREFEQLLRED